MEWSDLKKILFTWLALPLTALDGWIAWGRLPARVVMKYGPDGQPRSWTSRENAIAFDLKILAVALTFFTVIGFLIAFTQPGRGGARGAWIVMLCGGFFFLLLNGILWLYQVG
jgi:hypothetical protein